MLKLWCEPWRTKSGNIGNLEKRRNNNEIITNKKAKKSVNSEIMENCTFGLFVCWLSFNVPFLCFHSLLELMISYLNICSVKLTYN